VWFVVKKNFLDALYVKWHGSYRMQIEKEFLGYPGSLALLCL